MGKKGGGGDDVVQHEGEGRGAIYLFIPEDMEREFRPALAILEGVG